MTLQDRIADITEKVLIAKRILQATGLSARKMENVAYIITLLDQKTLQETLAGCGCGPGGCMGDEEDEEDGTISIKD